MRNRSHILLLILVCMVALVRANNKNPDIDYETQRDKAIQLLEDKEYEQAINETIDLYKRALKANHNYGLICSSELLGSFFLANQRDSSAIVAFKDALSRLEEEEGHLSYRLKIISNLIESHMKLGNLDETKALLQDFETTIQAKEQEKSTTDKNERDTNWHRWLQTIFYADLYLRQDQIDQAKEALDQSEQFYKSQQASYQDRAVFYHLIVSARYYIKIKKYQEALAIINSILEDHTSLECLKLKIEILSELGNFKDVLSLYDEAHEITRSMNNDLFVRQINNLRILYEKNDQLVKEKELQLNHIATTGKHRLFIAAIVVSFILLLLLIILSEFLRRIYILKNELEKERGSLLISKEKLKKEKKKAEDANRMKDAFIANISHEVSIPLNAIVGFSTLLSGPGPQNEKKEEFVKLITKNTNILLSLINNVLDLSSREAGHIHLFIQSYDLHLLCQKLLNNIQDKVVPGVELSFSPSITPYTLETDLQQLEQLLQNLLSNAAKFTTTGKIDLAYEIDEENEEAYFFVTDTGPGIPKDKQDIIFDRFEKLGDYSQGTGLGLPISQAIAEQFGGRLFLDLTYTAGSRFVFIHPFQKCELPSWKNDPS